MASGEGIYGGTSARLRVERRTVYEALGVPEGASLAECEAAYAQRVAEYRQESGGGGWGSVMLVALHSCLEWVRAREAERQ